MTGNELREILGEWPPTPNAWFHWGGPQGLGPWVPDFTTARITDATRATRDGINLGIDDTHNQFFKSYTIADEDTREEVLAFFLEKVGALISEIG